MMVPAASPPTVPTLVTLDAVRAAASRIAGVARVTPVVPVSSDETWAHLLVKCENLQVSGSFKVRGAFNFVTRLDPGIRSRGVITYSSGNHGQALAFAARRVGVPAVVVMPTTAPAVKVEGARRLGAEVQFAGTTSLHRKAAAEEIALARGLTMVPPFDHEHIVEGQGTTGLEILAQAPGVTVVYVPAGGGGLISGIAAAIRRLQPAVRIVGAEPEGAPKMTRSLAAGAPVTLDAVASIADGLLAVRPADLTFAHVRALVDEIVTVTDDELRDAMGFLARSAKLVAEPSGAAAVAAALRLAPAGSSGVHVAVISGGNVEPALLGEVLR
jgi:threo-3-hydroxy-L-aspartate ammonia-lyase